MAPPPAIHGPSVAGKPAQAQRVQMRAPTYSQGASQMGTNVKPNVSTSGKFGVQRGMSQAGAQAATQRASTLGGMSAADKIGATVQKATSGTMKGLLPKIAPSITGAASTVARVAAGPVVGGVAAAMTPTPANSGENEFARQAKYGSPRTNSPELTKTTSGKPTTFQKTPSVGPATDKFSSSTPATPKTEPSNSGTGIKGAISDIAKTNKIANVDKIYAGQKLDVGGGDKYTVQKGDNLTKIAKGFYGSDYGKSASEPASQSSGQADSTPVPPKRPANLKESVTVGNNKYRIV